MEEGDAALVHLAKTYLLQLCAGLLGSLEVDSACPCLDAQLVLYSPALDVDAALAAVVSLDLHRSFAYDLACARDGLNVHFVGVDPPDCFAEHDYAPQRYG